jgi:outer membrane protein assembly factor BamB
MMPGPAIDATAGEVIALGEGVLYTLALRDGAVIAAVGLRSPGGMSSPRIDDQRQVYVGTNTTIHSYSAASDKLTWQYSSPVLAGFLDVPLALSDSAVFTAGWKLVGISHVLRAVPVAMIPRVLGDAWREFRDRPAGGGILASARAALMDMLFTRGLFMEQWIVAVGRRSGRLLWEQDLGVGAPVSRNTSGAPVVAGNAVVISSPVSGVVWAFDSRSGRPLWHRQLSSRHKGAVTIVGNDVIFGDARGDLNAINLQDGTPIGRCNAEASFSPTAPIMVGSTIIVATQDGWVHARPYTTLRRKFDLTGSHHCFK